MKEVTFIHGADLHLDSPFLGLRDLPNHIFKEIQQSTFEAFHKLINTAIKEKVDFVILAGDLFDNDDRSIRAQTRFRKEMERLEEHHIEVYVVHGNHDFIGGSWTHVDMPSNVTVFGEKVEQKLFIANNGTTVHLYGFSYHARHVHERKIADYKKKEGADFHIGILHGNLEGSKEHGNYSPFQLQELLEKEMDYWALGHIHKRAVLHEEPPIIYPGNIQGRNKKETSKKGCYKATLNEYGCSTKFIETSSVIWDEVKIAASDCHSFSALFEKCLQTIDSIRLEGNKSMISIVLSNLAIENFQSDELLEALQENESKEECFVWPYKVDVELDVSWDKNMLAHESDFYGELFQIIESTSNIEDQVAPLFKHSIGRKFLHSFTEDEMVELMEEAEEILLKELLKK